jgi:cytochrome c553
MPLNSVRGVALAGLFAVGCGGVYADSVVPMEWTDQHDNQVASGNSERGGMLAATCDRCHGQNGVSDDDEIPHLAGQNARYIYKQLQDYKSGAREESGMREIADSDMPDGHAFELTLDGKPDDYDNYRGTYGIEDTRQALIEAKRDGSTLLHYD